MSNDWAEITVQHLTEKLTLQKNVSLILGGTDTGKTSLVIALARRLVKDFPIGIVDADIGQSHIGRRTTVGWAVIDSPDFDLEELQADGISFVGHVTPIGHLLQLTAAITQAVRHASKFADTVLIDTPGFVRGGAAVALWWTVQHILQPHIIIAVQKENELSQILAVCGSNSIQLEVLSAPRHIPTKSPDARFIYRETQFAKYFHEASLYEIELSSVAIQTNRSLSREVMLNRLVALRDADGCDMVLGIVKDWQFEKGIAILKAPKLDVSKIRCIVVGDITIQTA